jgi:hypothetical protein
VSPPSQRRALGALFLVLTALFAGITAAAVGAALDEPGLWVVAVAAAAMTLWLLGLALRSLAGGRRR